MNHRGSGSNFLFVVSDPSPLFSQTHIYVFLRLFFHFSFSFHFFIYSLFLSVFISISSLFFLFDSFISYFSIFAIFPVFFFPLFLLTPYVLLKKGKNAENNSIIGAFKAFFAWLHFSAHFPKTISLIVSVCAPLFRIFSLFFEVSNNLKEGAIYE